MSKVTVTSTVCDRCGKVRTGDCGDYWFIVVVDSCCFHSEYMPHGKAFCDSCWGRAEQALAPIGEKS